MFDAMYPQRTVNMKDNYVKKTKEDLAFSYL